jgi:hypothetical protein
MQRLEVSCVVRPIYGSIGAKGLILYLSLYNTQELQLLLQEVFKNMNVETLAKVERTNSQKH